MDKDNVKTSENDIKKMENSDVVLRNRANLSLTGLESVYEVTQTRLQLLVAGSVMAVTGENLSVTKLDVDSGVIEITGRINAITYTGEVAKSKNIFKRIFK